jgi:uncharacterized protein DUF6600
MLFSLLMIIGFPAQKAMAQADEVNVTYNDFYQNLAPYGQWIDEPKYGYVWSPDVDGSFRPYYTNGHWIMTDYGNTWISDYQWGWACFHYGRWIYDAYYGWLWIPGSNWGPAWVSWREGDGYYGWAPLGPDYNFGSSVGDYHCPNDWWVFIPCQYVYTGNYYRYYYGPRSNTNIIKNTNFINNTYENNHVTYVSGPQGSDIKHNTHQPVRIYKLTSSAGNLTTREHNGVIKMYRPAEIRPAGTANGERVAPPNAVAAPQPLTKAQPISQNGQYIAPEFRYDVPKPKANDAVGIHAVEAEKRQVQPRNTISNSNYEYDVNRPLPQPQNTQQQSIPQQQPAPRQQSQPQSRPQPAPQPQQVRQQPQPQPAPQRAAPAPAPAPAQRNTESGSRK